MKIRAIVVLLFMVIGLLFSACCSNGTSSMGRDQRTVMQELDNVVKAVQQKDAALLRSLFSENALAEAAGFDEATQELFAYFTGEVISCNIQAGPAVETTKEDGHILQRMDTSFEIQTSAAHYRLAMTYIAEDTADRNNEGIHCLYIIRGEDDRNLQEAYWGDGHDTAGIHIGVPNL